MARVPRVTLTLSAIAAMTAGGLGLGAGVADADVRTSGTRPAAVCLWDGAAHPTGTTVVAGGRDYVCGTDDLGAYWFGGPPTDRPDTVAAPGSRTDPAGRFSPGARQPGTSYNDYCVGSQLIPGTEDVYQVVRARDGRPFWKAAAPISQWRFDSDAARPEPTWRTPASCSEDNLI
ncbi:hypothetical protein [Nocardia mexicana]|uniref:Peptidase inhibitor family I36 n=1 Tax=Nocardia mexicana TaxID=279262 RepID=A0A370GJ61_9NOCA|nr:hypothetical protein [Nocardia mexicana]RDI43677.1 hypothetical protein DFR68_11964 [Nocardia mexicana]